MARVKPTLIETLAAKANELDDTAAKASASSAALAQQAAQQAEKAETARSHAAAVDQALGILFTVSPAGEATAGALPGELPA